MIGISKLPAALPTGLTVHVKDDTGATVANTSLFTDKAHTTTWAANPTTVDSSGEVLLYADTGWYQIVLGGTGSAADLGWNGGVAKTLPLAWQDEGGPRVIDATAITYINPYYKDQDTSLVGINPVGPATAPTADPNGEGWLFAGVATDNVAVLSRQINHDCQQGSVIIVPHIHWRKTTAAAGNVTWRLEYKYAAVGGDFGSYVQLGSDVSTPIDVTVDNNTTTRHLITSFGNLSMTVGLSTMLYFKLTRVASNTGTDTYNADALAMSFDFHYPIDSPGSAEQYVK